MIMVAYPRPPRTHLHPDNVILYTEDLVLQANTKSVMVVGAFSYTITSLRKFVVVWTVCHTVHTKSYRYFWPQTQ